jgi:imidazolonepropionase-like amidohydrolase
MKKGIVLILAQLMCVWSWAQPDRPTNGVRTSEPQSIGIKDATIQLTPTEKLEQADLLIENGRIVKIGHNLKFPAGTMVVDAAGMYLLPSFVEVYTQNGIKAPSSDRKQGWGPQMESNKQGPFYWNESIHPEVNHVDFLNFDPKEEERLLKMGFGFSVPHHMDGIARGTAPLLALGELAPDKKVLYGDVISFFSLQKGSSHQTYPSSQMGVLALLKQAFIDAQWYAESDKKPANYSLQALSEQLTRSLIFEATDYLEVLRISKLVAAYNLKATVICGGNEYARLDEVKATNMQFVLPLTFPDAFDVKNPYVAKEIPLSALKHWELAPSNPYAFFRAGMAFAFTAHGLEKDTDFWKAIHKTIARGLPWHKALEALTVYPAKIIGKEKEIGTLESGKLASFSMYSANPFLDKDAVLVEVWQQGQRREVQTVLKTDVRGNYNVKLGTKFYSLRIEGTMQKPTAKVFPGSDYKPTEKDTSGIACHITYNDRDIVLQFNVNEDKLKGAVMLNGKVYLKLGAMEGSGVLPDGSWLNWTAIKSSPFKETKKNAEPTVADTSQINRIWYPHMSFGRDSLSDHNTYLIRNATLWTGEEEGILFNADLLIVDGKIKVLGNKTFQVPRNARVIDATGKIVTAGIIDEHSHIAISKGVNESGQSITAEVSIGDVIDPDDINIYRQLAGGVTCSQLLHGSANAIGGQSALIKLKWGYGPDELLLDDAPKFIKFALGENVKQANWGDFNTVRFPQTRMGVEQVYYDAFYRARTYMEQAEKRSARKKGEQSNFRRDLELEALAEILKEERHITCHSYIQSEINMLMKVGDSLGFKVNTFTHILEGYKLADKMAKHGAGGSTFADWWAYKYEVIDAIPHNACLLHQQGVVTAINSDDAEMGRRLNQEAAKSIKYGGMNPHDAWKMVTLNPAKLLHLDKRMGSLKAGKDADIVIWSDNPLSVNAKVEYTFVDGQLLYNAQEAEQENKRNEAERARILSLMLGAAKAGEKTVPFKGKSFRLYHCDTEENEEHHAH